MRSMGVREFRQSMSRVLQEVSEGGQEISITSYGKEIARIMPPRKRKTAEEMADLWERINRIASEIGQYPSHGISSVDAIQEQRE